MDPISAIFVMTVLTGLFVKGVDVATDGLLSAEVGAGIRGAGSYTARDVRDRWRRASAKAREVRSQTRQGRAVQGILDDAAAVGRTGWTIGRLLFGEARQFGSGIRSEWQTARDQARSVRTERRGDAPWPVTQWLRDGLVRLQESRTKTPNEPEPNVCSRCGRTEQGDEVFGGYYVPGDLRLCDSCVAWLNRRYPEGWPDDPNEVSSFGLGQSWPESMRNPDQSPFGAPAAVVPPFGPESTTPAEGKPWAHVRYDGCLHVTGWATDEEGLRWPRYCGEPREPGWVLCPTHLAAKRADPDYPQDEVDEYREDPDHLGPDGYRPNPTPNGDPNVPLESTVPDENGDVRCGCCAQLHKPLAPGEHCPDCHIHDLTPSGRSATKGDRMETGPDPWLNFYVKPGAPFGSPATKGPSMDINSAPTAIAAAETFRGSFETLQSRADALAAEWDTLKNDADTLHGEIATFMDGMGDFAIGGEADTAASVGELSDSATSAKEQADNVVASISTAKETVDAYIDNLHLEYDASIEAAAGKAADVHSVMQD